MNVYVGDPARRECQSKWQIGELPAHSFTGSQSGRLPSDPRPAGCRLIEESE